MDADRFDFLTRSLSVTGTRRAVALALTGILAPVLAREDADAAATKKKCKKKNDKKDRQKCLKKLKKTQDPPVPINQCADGARNGAESDVDCGGGTCSRCGTGRTCANRNDCTSGLCAGTCQVCVNAGDCGNDADGVTGCACRNHESGQRFCTKNGAGDVRLLPAGTPCTACQGGEQCFPINGGVDGIECILPCGA